MVNKIVRTITFLLALGTKAAAALAQHAATLNLPRAEATDLPAKVAAVTASNAVHKEALLEMKNKRTALEQAVRAGRRFMILLRESLKETLGNEFSQAWTAAGFVNGLMIPRAAGTLLNALTVAEAYLAAHPIADGGAALATARATLLRGNLAAAMTAAAQHRQVVDQAITDRNEDMEALEQALRTLLRELHEVLDPLDSKWLAFGFNKPGAKSIPAVPQNVIATLIGAASVSLKWDSSARASYYRVWKKVVGVDEEYIPVGSPADLDFTLEGLPSNSQVEILVSAVNNGGESQKSTMLLVQTL